LSSKKKGPDTPTTGSGTPPLQTKRADPPPDWGVRKLVVPGELVEFSFGGVGRKVTRRKAAKKKKR